MEQLVILINQIIIAFIIYLLGTLGKFIIRKIRSFFYKRHMRFSIDGYWYAKHVNYQGDAIIELIKVKQIEEDIYLRIIQYKKRDRPIYIFEGRGIFVADTAALYYYSINHYLKQNGVMTLQIKPLLVNKIFMEGTYYEVSSEKNKDEGLYPLGHYNLYRLHLTLFDKLKAKLRKAKFSDYSGIEKIIGQYGEQFDL